MIALIAYPATYGVSGITTFIVNKDGVVHQRDLGARTPRVANAIKTYTPDSAWTKAEDRRGPTVTTLVLVAAQKRNVNPTATA